MRDRELATFRVRLCVGGDVANFDCIYVRYGMIWGVWLFFLVRHMGRECGKFWEASMRGRE